MLSNFNSFTLQAYCQLNEPYVTELCTAFRFFEGFALAGLAQPEKVKICIFSFIFSNFLNFGMLSCLNIFSFKGRCVKFVLN